MIRCFISTGCSFTDVPFSELQNKSQVNLSDYQKSDLVLSWPVHLINVLNCNPIYRGRGASGNGMISRTTIYEVNKALSSYDSDEILVGIMWSGAYRQEIYASEPKFEWNSCSDMGEAQNPSTVSGKRNFYRVMPYWEDDYSTWYYKYVYDDIGAYMQTLEHILRVQWFLKTRNIKYFMTTYYPLVFPKTIDIRNHPDIQYLYEMIDFTDFLDVDSEYEWCVTYQDPKLYPWYNDPMQFNNPHPNTLLHKSFTENVILPHLEKKGWIKKK